MQEKVLAVVTRAVNYRDHDRVLTLVTRTRGRLTVTAHGCRKPQSRLMPCVQPFCYGEYELGERGGRHYVRACELRENFYALRLDPQVLTAASMACVAAEEFANPEEDNARHFALLLYTLDALCQPGCDVPGVLVFFFLKLFTFSGYRPQADACVHCGNTEHLVRYDAQEGGAVCTTCAPQALTARRISAAALQALRALPDVPSACYGEIRAALSPVAGELLPLMRQTFAALTDRKLPSLDIF